MISIRTNVDSIHAQQNLSTNSMFQSKTIQQLTSGYRINNSGDDAAGLAIANSYRSSITELTQGVANGNDGVSQLQIIDGGLNNISTILDRMKTLATQSASGSFTGDRNTLNQEYQQLGAEITRQASNVNLNAGGTNNNIMNVYIGGASNSNNAGISVDLSGVTSAVDAASLGLASTQVNGGGVGFNNNTQVLTTPNATFLTGTSANNQTFTFNVYANGSAQTVTATAHASANGVSLSGVLADLNGQLSQYGITAGVDTNGKLQFSGANAFTVKDNGSSATNKLTSETAAADVLAQNTADYSIAGGTWAALGAGHTENLTFQTSGGSVVVNLTHANGDTLAHTISAINAQTAASGIYAVASADGTTVSFQSANSFSVSAIASNAGEGVYGQTSATSYTSTAPSAATGAANAQTAISSIDNAVHALGLIQGRVGAGENKLQYAISLAQSQISSFSTAESQIRDADVAAEAANLTKSQVLQQTSIAAMAQANAEPQSVLKLLQ
ncbi:MAG: hypothetical protein JO150_11960 [Acidobacteriaceae bacterium]|nr:hypothetical protein [Acidobacteriaceae bacterium]